MIKPEQVPEDVWVEVALRLESCGAIVSNEVAKLVAVEVINAWPGFTTEFRRDSFMGWNGQLIILPLTESKDDK